MGVRRIVRAAGWLWVRSNIVPKPGSGGCLGHSRVMGSPFPCWGMTRLVMERGWGTLSKLSAHAEAADGHDTPVACPQAMFETALSGARTDEIERGMDIGGAVRAMRSITTGLQWRAQSNRRSASPEPQQ
jgi:hypothetical protein